MQMEQKGLRGRIQRREVVNQRHVRSKPSIKSTSGFQLRKWCWRRLAVDVRLGRPLRGLRHVGDTM